MKRGNEESANRIEEPDLPIRLSIPRNRPIRKCQISHAPGKSTVVNRWLRLLDYVYLARPILFFPGWTTLLAGYMAARGVHTRFFSPGELVHPWPFPAPLMLLMIAFAAAMGGCFILNQLQDVATDRRNHKLFLLGEGVIPPSHGYAEAALLILLALAVGAGMGGALLSVLIIFVVVTGYLYNYPPFVWKDYPLRGLLANMAMGWLAFALGWLLVEPAGGALVGASLPYLLYNTALYLLTTVPDMAGDAQAQKVTFPVRYGLRRTLRLSGVGLFLALIVAGVLGDQLLLGAGLLASPFFLRAVLRETVASVVVAVKMGIFFLSLMVCVKFPCFLIMIAAAFIVTRFYYKQRFGIDYPNFKGS
ncbi:MAG: hypothetical protein D6681_12455 [Calditrichaeota bacterium]|nr:MAG: hypothetical protein D6681_12455 [Calditrichota bacterium]